MGAHNGRIGEKKNTYSKIILMNIHINPLFYVADTCMDCAHCYEIAPNTFELNKELMIAHVKSQPISMEDIEKAYAAKNYCPVEAIFITDDYNG